MRRIRTLLVLLALACALLGGATAPVAAAGSHATVVSGHRWQGNS